MGASTKHSPVQRVGLASATGLCPTAAGARIRAGPWDLAPCLDSMTSFAGSPIQSAYARLSFSDPGNGKVACFMSCFMHRPAVEPSTGAPGWAA